MLLFLGKLLSGLVLGSVAVIADAVNNLSDAASSVVTLVGFRLAGQQADEGHPFGHGRIEYVTGFVVAMAILLTGTPSLAVYLPVMIVISIITGFFTGLCAQFLVNRGNQMWKTFLK